jgi:SAM-dependent methyltransferase
MTRTTSLTAISELESVPDKLRTTSPNQGTERCPVCELSGAEPLLRAPDRLHGRQDQYTLVRCHACSLVWLSHPPKPEDMRLHYTAAYDELISRSGENSPHRWRDRKAALAPYKNSGALLDLGCSSGAFLESLDPDRWQLHAVEMSAVSAKIAEQRSSAKIFVGDVLEAPFRPESFDVITCFDVLEHVYKPREVLAKVAKWLKPGGIFYVLVPNVDSAESRVFGTYWHGLELPRHLFHFSPASLRNMAKRAGLCEVSLVTQRNPAVGTSLRYVWDDIFGMVGIHPTPVAYRTEPGLPWRVARKIVRITILRSLMAMAPLVAGGESIHAIFRKDDATL